MRAISMLFALLVLSATLAQAAIACNGADPAIGTVSVKNVSHNGGTNVYHLGGTVTNRGRARQPSNVLQFVDVYINGQKSDARGIPPLRPGQSYTFGYDFQRSSDAGDGTSRLRFQIEMRQPAGSAQNCNPNNDTFAMRV